MSFVAFPANFAGSPPAPFSPFAAGESVFYLVGVAAGEGQPAPGAQLSVAKRKTKGSGRNPVDQVTETAKGWQGRRRVTVATRSYTWSRYTRGALATARDSAQWSDPQGNPLRIWSNVVAVDNADDMGYRVPRGSINARRGNRGVGHENNARGTVQGRSIVPASGPSPVAPVVPVADVPAGFAGIAQEAAGNAQAARAAAGRTVPSWVASMSRDPDAVASRARAAAARQANLDALAARQAAVVAPVAPAAVSDPSIARFKLLDLSSAVAVLPPPTATDDGPGRVPMID